MNLCRRLHKTQNRAVVEPRRGGTLVLPGLALFFRLSSLFVVVVVVVVAVAVAVVVAVAVAVVVAIDLDAFHV